MAEQANVRSIDSIVVFRAAVINYIIAVRFDRAAEEVAGLVVASTAISFLTLPLLLYVVK